MKYFWIALGILAVILALALCLLSLLETCTEAVILHLQDAQLAAQQGDAPSALRAVLQAKAKWEQCNGMFCTLLNHSETDEITFLFSALVVCAEQPVEDELQFRCAELIAMLKHIAEMEKPYYYNIL